MKKISKVKFWSISCLNDSETLERWLKGDKIQIFLRGARPLTALEACAFGAQFRKLVSIYPRSAPQLTGKNLSLIDVQQNNELGFDPEKMYKTLTLFSTIIF